jgi:Transposase, Mutator family
MKKVPPSVRVKEEVDRVLRGGAVEEAPAEAPMQGFVRALARYILQVSIEEEATTFLGRGHYRRGERVRPGWRNGYEAKRLQTEAGFWSWRYRSCARPRNRSGRHWWSGWEPGPLIWKGWSGDVRARAVHAGRE